MEGGSKLASVSRRDGREERERADERELNASSKIFQ